MENVGADRTAMRDANCEIGQVCPDGAGMTSAVPSDADELPIPRELVAARGLCEYAEAACLELVATDADGRQHFLAPPAAAAWRALQAAAAQDGIELLLVSAFRSVARQAALVRRKLDCGASIEEVLTVCAPPGYSEHHTGCAVDVGAPGCALLEIEFERTPAFAWLMRRAGEHGFRLSYPRNNRGGYQYEPWHWCYAGA